jgi:hypothetical protein
MQTIKRCFSFMFAIICSIYIISGCSHENKEVARLPNPGDLAVTHSMKGWELYSLPQGNTWKFSFLIGTNRLKSLSEVTSSNSAVVLIRVTGVDSAKMVLDKFPQGESITLIGQDLLQNVWQGQYGNLQLPPQAVIDQLKSFAMQKGLTVTVAN